MDGLAETVQGAAAKVRIEAANANAGAEALCAMAVGEMVAGAAEGWVAGGDMADGSVAAACVEQIGGLNLTGWREERSMPRADRIEYGNDPPSTGFLQLMYRELTLSTSNQRVEEHQAGEVIVADDFDGLPVALSPEGHGSPFYQEHSSHPSTLPPHPQIDDGRGYQSLPPPPSSYAPASASYPGYGRATPPPPQHHQYAYPPPPNEASSSSRFLPPPPQLVEEEQAGYRPILPPPHPSPSSHYHAAPPAPQYLHEEVPPTAPHEYRPVVVDRSPYKQPGYGYEQGGRWAGDEGAPTHPHASVYDEGPPPPLQQPILVDDGEPIPGGDDSPAAGTPGGNESGGSSHFVQGPSGELIQFKLAKRRGRKALRTVPVEPEVREQQMAAAGAVLRWQVDVVSEEGEQAVKAELMRIKAEGHVSARDGGEWGGVGSSDPDRVRAEQIKTLLKDNVLAIDHKTKLLAQGPLFRRWKKEKEMAENGIPIPPDMDDGAMMPPPPTGTFEAEPKKKRGRKKALGVQAMPAPSIVVDGAEGMVGPAGAQAPMPGTLRPPPFGVGSLLMDGSSNTTVTTVTTATASPGSPGMGRVAGGEAVDPASVAARLRAEGIDGDDEVAAAAAALAGVLPMGILGDEETPKKPKKKRRTAEEIAEAKAAKEAERRAREAAIEARKEELRQIKEAEKQKRKEEREVLRKEKAKAAAAEKIAKRAAAILLEQARAVAAAEALSSETKMEGGVEGYGGPAVGVEGQDSVVVAMGDGVVMVKPSGPKKGKGKARIKVEGDGMDGFDAESLASPIDGGEGADGLKKKKKKKKKKADGDGGGTASPEEAQTALRAAGVATALGGLFEGQNRAAWEATAAAIKGDPSMAAAAVAGLLAVTAAATIPSAFPMLANGGSESTEDLPHPVSKLPPAKDDEPVIVTSRDPSPPAPTPPPPPPPRPTAKQIYDKLMEMARRVQIGEDLDATVHSLSRPLPRELPVVKDWQWNAMLGPPPLCVVGGLCDVEVPPVASAALAAGEGLVPGESGGEGSGDDARVPPSADEGMPAEKDGGMQMLMEAAAAGDAMDVDGKPADGAPAAVAEGAGMEVDAEPALKTEVPDEVGGPVEVVAAVEPAVPPENAAAAGEEQAPRPEEGGVADGVVAPDADLAVEQIVSAPQPERVEEDGMEMVEAEEVANGESGEEVSLEEKRALGSPKRVVEGGEVVATVEEGTEPSVSEVPGPEMVAETNREAEVAEKESEVAGESCGLKDADAGVVVEAAAGTVAVVQSESVEQPQTSTEPAPEAPAGVVDAMETEPVEQSEVVAATKVEEAPDAMQVDEKPDEKPSLVVEIDEKALDEAQDTTEEPFKSDAMVVAENPEVQAAHEGPLPGTGPAPWFPKVLWKRRLRMREALDLLMVVDFLNDFGEDVVKVKAASGMWTLDGMEQMLYSTHKTLPRLLCLYYFMLAAANPDWKQDGLIVSPPRLEDTQQLLYRHFSASLAASSAIADWNDGDAVSDADSDVFDFADPRPAGHGAEEGHHPVVSRLDPYEDQPVTLRTLTEAFGRVTDLSLLPAHIHAQALAELAKDVAASEAFAQLMDSLGMEIDASRKEKYQLDKKQSDLKLEIKTVEAEIDAFDLNIKKLEAGEIDVIPVADANGSAESLAVPGEGQEAGQPSESVLQSLPPPLSVGVDDGSFVRAPSVESASSASSMLGPNAQSKGRVARRQESKEQEKARREAERERKAEVARLVKERNKLVLKVDVLHRELQTLEQAIENLKAQVERAQTRLHGKSRRLIGMDRHAACYYLVEVCPEDSAANVLGIEGRGYDEEESKVHVREEEPEAVDEDPFKPADGDEASAEAGHHHAVKEEGDDRHDHAKEDESAGLNQLRPKGWGKGPVFGIVIEVHRDHKIFAPQPHPSPKMRASQPSLPPLEDGFTLSKDAEVDSKVQGSKAVVTFADERSRPPPLPISPWEKDLPAYRCISSVYHLKRLYECLNDRGIRERPLAVTLRNLFRRHGIHLSSTQWLHKHTAWAAAQAVEFTDAPFDMEAFERGEISCSDIYHMNAVGNFVANDSAARKSSPTTKPSALDKSFQWFSRWVDSLGSPLPHAFEETEKGRRGLAELVKAAGVPPKGGKSLLEDWEGAPGIGIEFEEEHSTLVLSLDVHTDDSAGVEALVAASQVSSYILHMAIPLRDALLELIDALEDERAPSKEHVNEMLFEALLKALERPAYVPTAVVDPSTPDLQGVPLERFSLPEPAKRKGRPPKHPPKEPRKKVFRPPPLLSSLIPASALSKRDVDLTAGWGTLTRYCRGHGPESSLPLSVCPFVSAYYRIAIEAFLACDRREDAVEVGHRLTVALRKGSWSSLIAVTREASKEMEEANEKEREEERKEKQRILEKEKERAKKAASNAVSSAKGRAAAAAAAAKNSSLVAKKKDGRDHVDSMDEFDEESADEDSKKDTKPASASKNKKRKHIEVANDEDDAGEEEAEEGSQNGEEGLVAEKKKGSKVAKTSHAAEEEVGEADEDRDDASTASSVPSRASPSRSAGRNAGGSNKAKQGSRKSDRDQRAMRRSDGPAGGAKSEKKSAEAPSSASKSEKKTANAPSSSKGQGSNKKGNGGLSSKAKSHKKKTSGDVVSPSKQSKSKTKKAQQPESGEEPLEEEAEGLSDDGQEETTSAKKPGNKKAAAGRAPPSDDDDTPQSSKVTPRKRKSRVVEDDEEDENGGGAGESPEKGRDGDVESANTPQGRSKPTRMNSGRVSTTDGVAEGKGSTRPPRKASERSAKSAVESGDESSNEEPARKRRKAVPNMKDIDSDEEME
ncbi:hypothetical protein HDU96_004023 [Phlyctochytrium bullatum]|nr:hypothetical protein HDU96_004023 [Phlyctochytrium bullatum]